MRWPGKRAGSENGPAYFHSLLHVKWELKVHRSELARLSGWCALMKRASSPNELHRFVIRN